MVQKRRAKGEGTVFRRSSDGLWTGSATVGKTDGGKQKRKTVYAKSQGEALKKLRALQSQLDEGLPPANDVMTVSQLLEMWSASTSGTWSPLHLTTMNGHRGYTSHRARKKESHQAHRHATWIC